MTVLKPGIVRETGFESEADFRTPDPRQRIVTLASESTTVKGWNAVPDMVPKNRRKKFISNYLCRLRSGHRAAGNANSRNEANRRANGCHSGTGKFRPGVPPRRKLPGVLASGPNRSGGDPPRASAGVASAGRPVPNGMVGDAAVTGLASRARRRVVAGPPPCVSRRRGGRAAAAGTDRQADRAPAGRPANPGTAGERSVSQDEPGRLTPSRRTCRGGRRRGRGGRRG